MIQAAISFAPVEEPASAPQNDRMTEAEVALRLAEHLLALPESGGKVEVAIDGASVKCGNLIIFQISEFLAQLGWTLASQRGRNSWSGDYVRGNQRMTIHSKSGVGDVVCRVGSRRIIAECKKGPLIKKPGSPERPLLSTALGQALLIDAAPDDIIVAAVPDTPAFRRIAPEWRARPLVRKSGIRICLVGQDGGVNGLFTF